jgi:hypothetical protein
MDAHCGGGTHELIHGDERIWQMERSAARRLGCDELVPAMGSRASDPEIHPDFRVVSNE